mmetsp:Transcript_28463/g.45732  ORF Transcript_28463/g.45732 Transcript_28463/m.45732 type:complete len:113 (+) Transcript_28463:48-386(+)
MALTLRWSSAYRSKHVAPRGTSAPRRDTRSESASRDGSDSSIEKNHCAKLDSLAEKLTTIVNKYPMSSNSCMEVQKGRFSAVSPSAGNEGKSSLDALWEFIYKLPAHWNEKG